MQTIIQLVRYFYSILKITFGHLRALATSAGENMPRSDSKEETISLLESKETDHPFFICFSTNICNILLPILLLEKSAIQKKTIPVMAEVRQKH